jgi:hypothetical protein
VTTLAKQRGKLTVVQRMPTSIRLKTKLLLFSVAFVSAFILALAVAHWYRVDDAPTPVDTKIPTRTIEVIDGDTFEPMVCGTDLWASMPLRPLTPSAQKNGC